MTKTEINKLIEDNINLVHFVMRKHYRGFAKDEDLIQCGMIGLCKAAPTWDENKGAFSTFAVKYIRTEIVAEMKRRAKHKGLISLDSTTITVSDSELPLIDCLVGKEDVEYSDADSLFALLKPKDICVLKLLMTGMTQAEIADQLGVSRECISQRVKRIRRIATKNGFI